MVPAPTTSHRAVHQEETQNMNNRLRELYESTADDMVYGIGLVQFSGAEPAPCIHISYPSWNRAQLEIVRESFDGGLVLTSTEKEPGLHHLHIGTRQVVAIHQRDGEHTSILRAPAWDAHLANVEQRALRLFEMNRERYGGFLVLMQTPEWEFLVGVEDACNHTAVGPVRRLRFPAPPDQASA